MFNSLDSPLLKIMPIQRHVSFMFSLRYATYLICVHKFSFFELTLIEHNDNLVFLVFFRLELWHYTYFLLCFLIALSSFLW